VPDPTNVNAIAATLLRNASAGQRNGTVLLRGFIYGSEFNYKKKNRIAIPANFFRPFDGQYLRNVRKYSGTPRPFFRARARSADRACCA
jgi:alpha-glucuronidase